MYDKSTTKLLFTNAQYGLQRVYNLVHTTNASGVTKDNITDYDNFTTSDTAFVQYLQQNFGTVDKDSNGTITESEFKKALETMSANGLTAEQISTLTASTTGSSKTLLDTVLSHFDEIDKNKDGKVSQEEINAYNLDKEINKEKAEMSSMEINNMSVFYGDDSASNDSTSLLDTDSNASTSSTSSTLSSLL